MTAVWLGVASPVALLFGANNDPARGRELDREADSFSKFHIEAKR
jgi:hypothetical protein